MECNRMNKSISVSTIDTSDKTETRRLQIALLSIQFSTISNPTAPLALVEDYPVTTPLSEFALCQNCPLLRLLDKGRSKQYF